MTLEVTTIERRTEERLPPVARQNRAAALAAAAEDVSRHGELSMRRVSSASGLSRSTLYRHFSTRSSLEDALREEALQAARRAIEDVLAEDRPPLAVLRRLVEALVRTAAERRLDALDVLPLGAEAEAVGAAMLPAVDRLLRAAEVAPSPPAGWLAKASLHLLNTCLEAGSSSPEDPRAAVEELFRSLTDPLDQGIVILDPDGLLLSVNPRAAGMLDPSREVEVGERLTEPRVSVLYEDGSAAAGAAYPLGAAVRTKEPQSAVRGHCDPTGPVTWIAVDARPLRHPPDAGVYGVLGILSDVTAERDWELRSLRPPGQLEPTRPVPLDLARTLDEIPPHLFPEQFVSEARRVSGGTGRAVRPRHRRHQPASPGRTGGVSCASRRATGARRGARSGRDPGADGKSPGGLARGDRRSHVAPRPSRGAAARPARA